MSPICNACQKPEELCVCSSLTPIETRLHVLILQHPQEPDQELGSARLAHLSLPNSTLRIGLSWPNLGAALGREAEPKRWLALYLGSVRPRPGLAPLALVGRDCAARPFPQELEPELEGLLLLDGSWSQAKTLWWRNPWLLKLRRGVLVPARPSLYRQLRVEPRAESISTLESVALALSALEGRPELEEQLLRPFVKLLERYALARGARAPRRRPRGGRRRS